MVEQLPSSKALRTGERESTGARNLSGGHQVFVVAVLSFIFPSWTHCVATAAWNSRCRPAYGLAALFSLNECWAPQRAASWSCCTAQIRSSLLYPVSPPRRVSSFPPSFLSLLFHVLFFDSLGIETDVHLATLFL